MAIAVISRFHQAFTWDVLGPQVLGLSIFNLGVRSGLLLGEELGLTLFQKGSKVSSPGPGAWGTEKMGHVHRIFWEFNRIELSKNEALNGGKRRRHILGFMKIFIIICGYLWYVL